MFYDCGNCYVRKVLLHTVSHNPFMYIQLVKYSILGCIIIVTKIVYIMF